MMIIIKKITWVCPISTIRDPRSLLNFVETVSIIIFFFEIVNKERKKSQKGDELKVVFNNRDS